MGTVEKLEQQINILSQPRQLEQLSRRLKSVTGELERVQELHGKDAAATGISSDAEHKVLAVDNVTTTSLRFIRRWLAN